MAKEAVKSLTQAQKNYLVKRINEVANTKIGKLGGPTNYGSRHYHNYNCNVFVQIMKHKLDVEAVQAIIDGKVRLRSKVNMIAGLKALVANYGNSYFKVELTDFIDPKSLEEFNIARGKKAKDDLANKVKRISSVKDEADKLKDSVMLDGNLAIELLERFEKKEF